MGFTLNIDVKVPLASFPLEVAFEMKSEALAVLGPSGSGKTTLLETICGVRDRARGEIKVGDRVLMSSARRINVPPEQRRIGYVPQDSLLFPHLSIRQNILFGSGSTRAKMGELAELLDLSTLLDRSPITLSGGERQRVALARAIAIQPALLVLDEPLAAVDLQLKQRILPYLLRIRKEFSLPMIYVTHQWSEARALCEETAVLTEGKLVRFGRVEEVLGSESPIDDDTEIENIFSGQIELGDGDQCLKCSSDCILHVQAAGLRAGQFASFAVRADDVIVSLSEPRNISARNIIAGRIERIRPLGGEFLLYVRAPPKEWLVKVTPGSLHSLHLVPNTPVFLVIKANSFRRL